MKEKFGEINMLTVGKFYKSKNGNHIFSVALTETEVLADSSVGEEWRDAQSIIFPLNEGKFFNINGSHFFDLKLLDNGKIKYLTIRISDPNLVKFNVLEHFEELS